PRHRREKAAVHLSGDRPAGKDPDEGDRAQQPHRGVFRAAAGGLLPPFSLAPPGQYLAAHHPMSTRGTYRISAMATATILVEVLAWGLGLAFWFSAAHYLPQFRVQRPEVLWALLAGPVLVLLYLLALVLKNRALRSEEHTSELQSRENLVC